MSRGNRPQGQPSVNDGTQRFEVRKLESTILEANGNFDQARALAAKSLTILQDGAQLQESAEAQTPFWNAAIQDVRMTVALFVETKFIPEHVQYKTRAGQTHYQAMLKHLITPETVSRIFDPERTTNARMKVVADWPYLDTIRLCDLRSEHVRRIVSAADNAGYSAQTVKHIKHVCFAIIAHAQKEGCFIGPNPASLVKLPRTARTSSPGLTREQSKAILDMLEHPYREVALFALTTGISLPEICDLRWKHMNFDNTARFADGNYLPACTLVVKTWMNCGGLGDSRASRKDKIIEIREPLLSTLRELRAKSPIRDIDDLVLVTSTGEQIDPASFRAAELKRVGRALGIPRLTWQDLRRTHKEVPPPSIPQPSNSALLRAGTTSADWASGQAVSCGDVPRERAHRDDSRSSQAFCFGRRFGAGSEARVMPDNHGAIETANPIV
jgi:integrase